MRARIAFVTMIALVAATALAQGPYVREQSIGVKKTEDTQNTFPFRPIEKWIGERFIFLPMPSSQARMYGYQSFKGGTGPFGNPTYEECVGRIGVIESVKKGEIATSVRIKMLDNGRIYKGEAYGESLGEVAPVADLDSARARWLGKTYWYRDNKLVGYDEVRDEFVSAKVPKYGPVQVVAVMAGWYESVPVRLVLHAPSGAEGFEDLNVSNTNVAEVLRKFDHFEEYFMEQDPRTVFTWDAGIWTAIENEQVFVGMTAEQARMSWDEPKEINTTQTSSGSSEQWVYPNGAYLYVEGGIVVTVQNRK